MRWKLAHGSLSLLANEAITRGTLLRSKVIVERARLRHLVWGEPSRSHRLLLEWPTGYDVIVGADVVYASEFVPQLFQTAESLLSRRPQVSHLNMHVQLDIGMKVMPDWQLPCDQMKEALADAAPHTQSIFACVCRPAFSCAT